jgi:hypothetical protein
VPIFAFMGSNVFHRDDWYSFKTLFLSWCHRSNLDTLLDSNFTLELGISCGSSDTSNVIVDKSMPIQDLTLVT